MQLPLQVSFRQLEPSAEIEAIVAEKAAVLDRFADRIMSCRVTIEPAGKHRRQGNQYAVHIDLKLPGHEIAISREPSQHVEHREIGVTLRDAFDAARRQIEDFVRVRRSAVKAHEPSPHAKVARLFPDQGYGFVVGSDGREIYFHRHSVLDDAFDRLEAGSEVSVVEEQGERGPQASTVKLVGRHGGR